jgi:hypothetical protein
MLKYIVLGWVMDYDVTMILTAPIISVIEVWQFDPDVSGLSLSGIWPSFW